MQNRFRQLATVGVPTAACAYWFLIQSNLGSYGEPKLAGIAAFACVALLSELMAVDFRLQTGGHQPRSSMAFLPFIGSIVLFPAEISVGLIAGTVAISQFLFRRNGIWRSSYNVAQAMLTACVAAAATAFLENSPLAWGHLPGVVGAMVFFGMNIVLVSAGLSYLKDSSFVDMLGQVAGPNGSNLRYDLLAMPIAFVPVLLYSTSAVLGILVIVLPLLLINYSHVTKKEVIEANKDLLRALVKAIETRDPYTSGHSERVAGLAKMIAKDMRLPTRQMDLVEVSALLHDIGKIDPVFAEVLRKPYDLTPAERALIQTHPARGADLLRSLRSVPPAVVSAVLHHHERYDGKGYPVGVAGQDIPLIARIIMLCDSVDAMLSDRPYRKALTLDHVYSELTKYSGVQFDPVIVHAILQNGTLDRAHDMISRNQAEKQPPQIITAAV